MECNRSGCGSMLELDACTMFRYVTLIHNTYIYICTNDRLVWLLWGVESSASIYASALPFCFYACVGVFIGLCVYFSICTYADICKYMCICGVNRIIKTCLLKMLLRELCVQMKEWCRVEGIKCIGQSVSSNVLVVWNGIKNIYIWVYKYIRAVFQKMA